MKYYGDLIKEYKNIIETFKNKLSTYFEREDQIFKLNIQNKEILKKKLKKQLQIVKAMKEDFYKDIRLINFKIDRLEYLNTPEKDELDKEFLKVGNSIEEILKN